MKQSFKLAFSGIICAISIVVMFLSIVFPTAEYAISALAGVLLVAIVIDVDFKSAVLAYVVVAVVSALLVANKQTVILFIAFLGYYPILKGRIELFKNKAKEWIFKLITFNIAIVFVYYLFVTVAGVQNIFLAFDNVFLVILGGFLIANIVFVIYDFALSRVISLYVNDIRKRIIRK